jgi:hypothetical protein
MKRLLALFIILQSCNDYEVLPDGRKYTLKDSCLRGHIEHYNYTTYMVVNKMTIPQYHSGERYVCDELRVDTVFIKP